MVARLRLARIRGLAALAWPHTLFPWLLTVAGCSDPVHDALVASLGPEDPSVGPGPTHRPGQPCVACHGDLGPAKLAFSVGGTVYQKQGSPIPAPGAQVLVEDQDGRATTIPTNAAGNFFVTPSVFLPNYPTRMRVASTDGTQVAQMISISNREGSCAMCHFDPPGPTSPGPVFIAYNLGAP
jgi:hypothetical protein